MSEPPTPADEHYATVMRRLTKVDSAGAGAIMVVTAAALWGHPRLLAISIACFILLLPLNAALTLWLLPRWGPLRGELVRTFMNVICTVAINHLTGWPLPTWLWLPYIALAFDGDRRLTWAVLGTACVANGAFALLDGVRWVVPLSFTIFAVFARVVSDTRLSVLRDAHDRLADEVTARKQAEGELLQAQKLEAIGRLASGIAHEINTPLQFVSDSVQFIEDGTTELLDLCPAEPSTLNESIAYLRANLPEAIRLTHEGLGRVSAIVSSLREFAHPTTTRASLDLNHAVQAALTLTKHEYKYVADVSVELGKVPAVQANGGEISQVLVNLIVNAAHAIAERGHGYRGTIHVKTALEGRQVLVAIEDDGVGIDDTVKNNLYDPFFTTKPVGHGTGQGLTIARSIVDGHAGSLSFTSQRGLGTTFYVRLPAVSDDTVEQAA